MNYHSRIERLRAAMEQRGVDAFLTTSDANWEYLTGLPRLGGGNTKQRQHSIEYTCLIVTQKEIAACMPSLSMLITLAKLNGQETAAQLIPFPDGDTDGVTFKAQIAAMGLQGKRIGVSQDISAATVLMLQNCLDAKVIDLNDVIFGMRAVKDAEELALIRKGAEICDKIYYDILSMIRPGLVVEELEREIDRLIPLYGASKSSFPSEANTHGPRAGHFVGFSSPTMEKGDVIGLDYGVVYQGYCTDFGRTIFLGEPSAEHVKIYELVRQAQRAAMDTMRPGSCGQAADFAARSVITEAGYGKRFIHKLGHSIGLDVHERPFLAKGETQELRSGMIYAVEPSVFIPRSCFIRVEDEIAITDTGCEMYSKVSQELAVVD